MQINKPYGNSQLGIQDDHYWRMADMSFRHLSGAWQNYKNKSEHSWIKGIDNDSPQYGRSEHVKSMHEFALFESEEYTQAIGSVLFSHVWILSAANYFRLSYKLKIKHIENLNVRKVITRTGSPKLLAVDLGLPTRVIELGEELHGLRNTIMHLVEGDPKTSPIHKLDFNAAYIYSKVTWIIYCALLRNYGIRPDHGSWKIQTSNYSLPNKIAECNE